MSFVSYPAYRESGVEWLGDFPAHWTLKPFWALFRRVKRTGFEQEQLLSVYRDHGIIPKASRDDNFNKASEDLSAYQLVVPGDFCVNKMKAWQGSVGVSEHRGIVSPAYFVYERLHGETSRYLHYLLRSLRYITGYLTMSKGIRVNQWDLEPELHGRTPVLVPPREEQIAIAQVLDRETAKIDALVEEQERLIELLKEKRQAVISHAVTKGLNPDAPMTESGVPWIGQIPDGWEVKHLRRLSPRLAGRLIVQPHQYFVDDGVPILFGNNIGRGDLHLEDLKFISSEADRQFAACRVFAGDLLTIRVGDPGATVVVPGELDGCHFASAMLIRKSPTFDSRWLCHVMNSDVIGAQVDAVNYGAAQKQFNIGDAANFLLPVPPLAEQVALRARLDEIIGSFDALALESRRAIDILQERRVALISAAVTGQIDVRTAVERSAA